MGYYFPLEFFRRLIAKFDQISVLSVNMQYPTVKILTHFLSFYFKSSNYNTLYAMMKSNGFRANTFNIRNILDFLNIEFTDRKKYIHYVEAFDYIHNDYEDEELDMRCLLSFVLPTLRVYQGLFRQKIVFNSNMILDSGFLYPDVFGNFIFSLNYVKLIVISEFVGRISVVLHIGNQSEVRYLEMRGERVTLFNVDFGNGFNMDYAFGRHKEPKFPISIELSAGAINTTFRFIMHVKCTTLGDTYSSDILPIQQQEDKTFFNGDVREFSMKSYNQIIPDVRFIEKTSFWKDQILTDFDFQYTLERSEVEKQLFPANN